METPLRVTWTIATSTSPRVWRHCGRCALPQPFVCSDRFRLNAQKKLIDVWLIYRCQACGRRWNLPIFERRPVGTIDPIEYQAMTANDIALAQRYAFDAALLQRHAARIEAGETFAIDKRSLGSIPAAPARVVISIETKGGGTIRLDRLIATGFGLPRGIVRQLEKTGAITVRPEGKAAFKRQVRHGQVIEVGLDSLAVRPDLVSRFLTGALSQGFD